MEFICPHGFANASRSERGDPVKHEGCFFRSMHISAVIRGGKNRAHLEELPRIF